MVLLTTMLKRIDFPKTDGSRSTWPTCGRTADGARGAKPGILSGKTVRKQFRKEQKLYAFLVADYCIESSNAIYLQAPLETLQDIYSILYHFL